jgi:hypothetical protein
VGGLLAAKATIQNHDFDDFHLVHEHANVGGEAIEKYQTHNGDQQS